MSQGPVRPRGSGSWELKFDLGRDPLTAKRQSRYVSFKGTKREAQVELTRLLAETNIGTYVDPSKLALAAFLDRLARDWIPANVSPKTGERYRQLLDNQVKPHIGALPIQKLRPVHLSELYAKLLREGGVDGGPLSARSVGHTHRCLRRAFGHATQWGVITTNPSAVVSPPKVQDKEIEIIRGFMPKQMTDVETRSAIDAVIAETGAASVKDMGKVMGALKSRFAGQMDFAKAGAAVKDALSAKK